MVVAPHPVVEVAPHVVAAEAADVPRFVRVEAGERPVIVYIPALPGPQAAPAALPEQPSAPMQTEAAEKRKEAVASDGWLAFSLLCFVIAVLFVLSA